MSRVHSALCSSQYPHNSNSYWSSLRQDVSIVNVRCEMTMPNAESSKREVIMKAAKATAGRKDSIEIGKCLDTDMEGLFTHWFAVFLEKKMVQNSPKTRTNSPLNTTLK